MRSRRSGKRLLHTALLQERCKCGRRILLAAVTVESQISGVASFAESCPKCAGDQICAGVAGNAIADDPSGKEVENDAQIMARLFRLTKHLKAGDMMNRLIISRQHE